MVFFDFQAFEMQRFGGISRSYAELISHLQKDGVCCKVGLKESDNVYINMFGAKVKPLYSAHHHFFSERNNIIGQRSLLNIITKALGHQNYLRNLNQEYCIKLLKKQIFDIFEPTFFDSYFLPFLKGKPFVITVHDMIPELFPQYFARDDFQIVNKKILCPLAAAIHVPSSKTKDDLVNILKIDPQKITVIHHGTPKIVKPYNKTQRPINSPYLLFVGARWEYKNFDLMLHEFAIIAKSNIDLHLICTGASFNSEEKRLISALHLTERVHHIFATDENLYSIYHHAVAFVFPSAYEGFGLPILEAYYCGCPVLLNKASCFPEIGGDAAIFFDINQRGNLAEHIISIYKLSSEGRNALIAKGKERLTYFSWDKSAKQLKQLYNSLL